MYRTCPFARLQSNPGHVGSFALCSTRVRAIMMSRRPHVPRFFPDLSFVSLVDWLTAASRQARRLRSFRRRRLVPPRIWWEVSLLVTASCGGRSGKPADAFQIALSPASFPTRLSLQQQVHVERDGRDADFDAVLDISPEAVTLVGLGFGQRLFTLRYDGTRLEESRSPFLPRDVRGRDVLSDIQLALWPADAVRAALPARWTLRDDPGVRVLSKGDEAITSITYDSLPRWKGLVTLHNKQFGYRLVIRPAPEQQ